MGLLNKRSGPEKVKREVTIVNKLGLHARPAAMFVRVANKHRAEIWVEKDGEQVNGKSIMGLMMLAAGQGTRLLFPEEVRNAARPCKDLEPQFEGRLNEKYPWGPGEANLFTQTL